MYLIEHIEQALEQQEQLKALLLAADPDWQLVKNYLAISQVYAIKNKGQWIAEICVTAVTDRADEAEIKNLSVDVAYQGQGLAKILIRHVIKAAAAQNIVRLWVKTGNSSLDQLALYQKMGFRLSHIEKDIFLDYPEAIYENGIRCLDHVVLVRSRISENV